MQLAVGGYALRLNRLFGTTQVGWSLFCSFALLALLHLVQSAISMNSGVKYTFPIEIVYVLISLLLLISLFHLETLLKERLRMEAVEKKLRADLEYQVKKYAAQLNRLLDELELEIEQRKRLQTQFDQTQEELLYICRGPGTPRRS
jgi:C4-dicarboxylate-specific signal transduction histidine kinase